MQKVPPLRLSDVLLLFAAALFSLGAIGALTLAPKGGAGGVAVVFSPWTRAEDALSRAVEPGARFIRFGAFDFIAVVEQDSGDYIRRVRANGAWFVADPVALAACLQPLNIKSRT